MSLNPVLYNPFTYLPSTLCESWNLPAIATCQDEATYVRRRSEVSAILMLPHGADLPGNWENIDDWVNTVDNAETDDSKAKYLVGIGSFLPDSAVEVSLSGGRYVEQRERTYRLNMAVLNIDDGHNDLCRKLQMGARRYTFWLLTVGDRLIGGAKGMKPVRANADFVLASGKDSREVWNITLTTTFLQYPAMTSQAVDFTGTGLSGSGGGGGGDCACDIQTLLGDLPSYQDDAAAIAGGMSTGQWYMIYWGAGDDGNDAYQKYLPKKIGS